MHTIAARGQVHTDAQGQVNRMVGVSWDITEQKTAEEAIRRLNADLEQRVAQRTAEVAATAARLQISNDSLQEAVEQLRELDRMKSQFVSNVSHELRTPLTNIKLYLDLLEHGKPEKHDKYMDTLKREADLLQRLIEDLLHLSRLDMGKSQPMLAAVDLNDLARLLANDLAALFAERGLALRLALEQGLPPVSADSKLLTQVLTNLMANAMNYTPAFGTVTMRTQSRLDGAESWVILSVADTGPGSALRIRSTSASVLSRRCCPAQRRAGHRAWVSHLPGDCQAARRAAYGRERSRQRQHLHPLAAAPLRAAANRPGTAIP